MSRILYSPAKATEMAKLLFKEERSLKRIDGWFLARELARKADEENGELPKEMKAALGLSKILAELPISISENAVFAGTQRDAFARTYALINPAFRVETFCGYCDPTSVFDDIEPNEEFTRERIDSLREYTKKSDYVQTLTAVYDKYEDYTAEVAFFIEQVTGHLIPDFRPALKYGVKLIMDGIDCRLSVETDEEKITNFNAMKLTLKGVVLLANRYGGHCRRTG
jgi:formate C-acetyltransferase